MENILSSKSNWKHAVLEYQIKEIDTEQDISRSAITNRAIIIARDEKNWNCVKEKLASIRRMDITIPSSMQAKLDELSLQVLPDIKKKIFDELGLDRLQTPYLIQLLWVNYLEYLKANVLNVGVKKAEVEEELTGPEMVKLLVQILLLNRKADAITIEKLKDTLLEWKKRQ